MHQRIRFSLLCGAGIARLLSCTAFALPQGETEPASLGALLQALGVAPKWLLAAAAAFVLLLLLFALLCIRGSKRILRRMEQEDHAKRDFPAKR